MKKLLLTLIVSFFGICLFAQNYTAIDNDAQIKFSVKNFGLSVSGSFKGLKGKLSFNPASLSAASITASVDAATVNTGNKSRDGHLKKEEYFNVEKYPLIGFNSTKITKATKPGTFLMEGKITIKGISKSVSFPFTATSKEDGYLFEGEFKLNRRDFGVGGKSMVLSDNITISLSVFAKKGS